MGSEFKNIVDGLTGSLLLIELCEGEGRMRVKLISQDLGATAACIMRSVVFLRNIL